MNLSPVLRRMRFVLILLPIVALAQVPPPPPLTPLPPPPVPLGNPITPAKTNLGKVLFWDEQLSSSRTAACGTCHRAENGGSDPRSQLGVAASTNPGPDGVLGTDDDVTGSPGVPLANADGSYALAASFGIEPQVTTRHTPSHINSGYAPNSVLGRARARHVPGPGEWRHGVACRRRAREPGRGAADLEHRDGTPGSRLDRRCLAHRRRAAAGTRRVHPGWISRTGSRGARTHNYSRKHSARPP